MKSVEGNRYSPVPLAPATYSHKKTKKKGQTAVGGKKQTHELEVLFEKRKSNNQVGSSPTRDDIGLTDENSGTPFTKHPIAASPV